METAPTNVAVFKALGDPTRHLISQVLSHQELAVNELAESLQMPQSTVSRHLRVLREAGLVTDRREGVTVYCRVLPDVSGDDPLACSICRWFKDQPLPPEVAARVERILQRRRRRSSEFFDRRGAEWDDLRRGCFGHDFPLEAVLGLLPSDWVVADLGTGTGYLLPALGRVFGRVIAVDHSRSMLARARQRANAHGLSNVEMRWGELEALPIETDRLDLAVAMLVLHHVGDPVRALGQIARVLRPGGTLLIVELAEHQDDELRQSMGDLWMGFSAERLSSMAAEVGMDTRRIVELGSTSAEQETERTHPSLYALIAENTGTA